MSETDILLKLFDTLKDASKETQQLCHTMLTNQANIGTYIKQLPMTDLKDALKEHSKEASDEIGVCTETVETTTDNILEKVKLIENRIGKMILVVIVAFTLFSSALFVARYMNKSDITAHEKLEKVITTQNKQIAELQKTIDELHQENGDDKKPSGG